MVYKKCATVLYHCYSCFFLFVFFLVFFFVVFLFLIIIIILFFAPPAPFVGYINWTCHYVTDKELINLPWFLAPFAPDWMFAVSWLNPQHLFLTRTLPRSHAHFWNPTMDLTSWLGSSNWLWNVLLVCVSVFHLVVSGCNKEVIYLILSLSNGLVGCKVPTDLLKISVKEIMHMGFYHIIIYCSALQVLTDNYLPEAAAFSKAYMYHIANVDTFIDAMYISVIQHR